MADGGQNISDALLVSADELRRGGALTEAAKKYKRAKERFERQGDSNGVANACVGLAKTAIAWGRYGEVADHLICARAACSSDEQLLGEIELQEGHCADYQENRRFAADHYEEAHAHFERAGDNEGKARALIGLGRLSRLNGERSIANRHLTRAEMLLEGEPDSRRFAKLQVESGLLAADAERPVEAEAKFRASEQTFSAVKDTRGRARSQLGLARLMHLRCENDDARRAYSAATLLFHKAHDRRGEAEVQLSIGDLEARAGRVVQARKNYKRALRLFGRVHSQHGQARARLALGHLDRRLGDEVAAAAAYRDARIDSVNVEDRLAGADVARGQGLLDTAGGRFDEARTSLERASSLAEKEGRHHGRANVLLAMARLAVAEGRPDVALEQLRRAELVWHEGPPLDRAGRIEHLRALAHDVAGERELAAQCFHAAIEHFGTAGDVWRRAEVLLDRANSCLDAGEYDTCRGALEPAEKVLAQIGDLVRMETVAQVRAALVDRETGEEECPTEAREPVDTEPELWELADTDPEPATANEDPMAAPFREDRRRRRDDHTETMTMSRRIWRYVDRQDPLMSAVTIFGLGLLLVMLSAPLGLNEPSRTPYGNRHVGYKHAVNWSLGFTFFAPLFVFLALNARDAFTQLINRCANAGQLNHRWNEARDRGFRAWCLFVVVGVGISLGGWFLDSAKPLWLQELPRERDWAVGLALSDSAIDRVLNAAFALGAFTLQAYVIVAAVTFVFAAISLLRLLPTLPEAAFHPGTLRQSFEPTLRRVLLAGVALYALVYLASIWELFLREQHARHLFAFLGRWPSSWYPENLTDSSFVLAAAGALCLSLCIAIPFAVAYHAKGLTSDPNTSLREVWPIAGPRPSLLLGLGVFALATIVVYWLGAVAIVVALVVLLLRLVVRPGLAYMGSKSELAPTLRQTAVARWPWWGVSLLAATSVMVLAVVAANVGNWWRAVLALGAVTFLVALWLNPERRYARLASTLVGAVVAANALPSAAAGFSFTLGESDFWGRFINEPPGLEFTISGFVLAFVLVLLDFRTGRARAPQHVDEPSGDVVGAGEAGAAVSKHVWVPAVAFSSVCVAFLISTFFVQPNFTPDQRATVSFFFAFLGGLGAAYMGGSGSLRFDWPKSPARKLTFSATGGVAVFVLLAMFPPYRGASGSVGAGECKDQTTALHGQCVPVRWCSHSEQEPRGLRDWAFVGGAQFEARDLAGGGVTHYAAVAIIEVNGVRGLLMRGTQLAPPADLFVPLRLGFAVRSRDGQDGGWNAVSTLVQCPATFESSSSPAG